MDFLRTISDGDLIQRTKTLVQKEREIMTSVLHHLREIFKRRLYSKEGYRSLHEYCVQELKFSDAAAYRRIEAMKLIQEIPEAEDSLKTGKVNLTTLSHLQSFYKAQEKKKLDCSKKSPAPGLPSLLVPSKKDLLKSIEGKSVRESEKLFSKMDPQIAQKDKERRISEEQIEIRVTIDEKLKQKLDRVKELNAHKFKDAMSYSELFHLMADFLLEKTDPLKKEVKLKSPAPGKLKVGPEKEKIKAEEFSSPMFSKKSKNLQSRNLRTKNLSTRSLSTKNLRTSRSIPQKIRTFVYQRDRGQCRYVNTQTGRRCQAKAHLQMDHIRPFSLGGRSDDPNNLRILCSEHNRVVAIEKFGEEKMGKYLGK